MSRKILQVGSDILTINDKLVSVKEDYPFWRVNADTSEQYWKALFNDRREVEPIIPVTILTGKGNYNIDSWITAPNGMMYGHGVNDNFIYKLNPQTETISIVANMGGTSKGGVLYSNFIYFTPNNNSVIVKFNTITETFTSFGVLGVTTNKFGSPCLSSNGKIYASPHGVAQWLIIEPENNDTITLIPQLANGGLTGGCIDGGNDWIYSCPETANNFQTWTKINKNDNTIVSYRPANSVAYYHRPSGVVEGKIIFHATSNSGGIGAHMKSFTIVDTKNADAISLISLPGPTPSGGLTDVFRKGVLGMDNNFYFMTAINGTSYRFNPYTNVVETLVTYAPSYSCSGGGIDKNGTLFWVTINGNSIIKYNKIYDNVQDNRILSRLINKS
jgi:hypothetical protein